MSNIAANLRLPNAGQTRLYRWAPMLLWCLIMTTFAQFRTRTFSELFESDGIDSQVMFQAGAWAALGCLAIWLIETRRADLRLLRGGPMLWYCCFVATALISAVYSPQPAYTAYRAMQHAIAIVLVISLREHLRHVYTFIAAYIGVNWILVILGGAGINFGMSWIADSGKSMLVFDGMEEAWRFGSAFGHPSQISILAAAGATGLAYRLRGRQWRWGGLLVAWFILTTILTVSRTAIAGMFAGLAIALVGRRALLPYLCVAGIVLPLVLISADVREIGATYLLRGQDEAGVNSLTDRVPVFEEAVQRISEYWPVGEGFQSGRIDALDPTGQNVGLAHAHNLVLESLSTMGLAGLIFAVGILLSLAAAVWKLLLRDRAKPDSSPSIGWELTAMMAPMYAFCVLDSGFVSKLDPISLLFLVVICRAQTALLDGDAEPTEKSTVGGTP